MSTSIVVKIERRIQGRKFLVVDNSSGELSLLVCLDEQTARDLHEALQIAAALPMEGDDHA